jgi:NAD-dependent dihydropyrimidine dehydrogenase PreA subunit
MKQILLAVSCAFFMAVSVYAGKKLVTYYVDQSLCKQCEKCIPKCPNKAKKVTVKNGKKIVEIDPELCTKDGKCTTDFQCPNDAIKVLETKKKR